MMRRLPRDRNWTFPYRDDPLRGVLVHSIVSGISRKLSRLKFMGMISVKEFHVAGSSEVLISA